jgi:hypothetical protein
MGTTTQDRSFNGADRSWTDNFDIRYPGADRRHGCPFPLPRLSPGFKGDECLRRVDEAIRSINSLAGTEAGHKAAPAPPLRAAGLLPLTAVQDWVLSDLRRRVELLGSTPEGLDEEAALRDLLQTDNQYDLGTKHLGSYDIDKIKVLQRNLKPRSAESLLPPATAGLLRNFSTCIEHTEADLETIRNEGIGISPYWDPKLRRSKSQRILLYQALHRCGLLTFRRTAKAKIGFFCVKKKDGMLRLIVDARVPNACHQRPPTTRLATPEAFSNLDLSSDTLEEAGFGGVWGDSQCDSGPDGLEGDVGDCFYNFQIQQLASWFSTGDWFSVEELKELGLDVNQIWDDQIQAYTPVQPQEALTACFCGICMGWSWALHFANEIVCHQATHFNNYHDSDLIRDKHPVPLIRPGKPVVGVYVDNIQSIGGTPYDTQTRMTTISNRFDELGIPFTVSGREILGELHSLGLVFRFGKTQQTLVQTHKRAWKLYLATKALCKRWRIKGEVLRIWAGHIVNFFQIAKLGLSCLHATYKFIESALGKRTRVWGSVRHEMKLTLGLFFISGCDLGASVSPEAYIGDSSDWGYSLMVSPVSNAEVRQEIRYKEKWRFQRKQGKAPTLLVSPADYAAQGQLSPLGGHLTPYVPVTDLLNSSVRGSRPGAGRGANTKFGKQLSQQAFDLKQLPFAQTKQRSTGKDEFSKFPMPYL